MVPSAAGRVLLVGGKLLDVASGRVADVPADVTYGFQVIPGTDYFATTLDRRASEPPIVWNGRGEVVYRCATESASADGASVQLSPAVLDALCAGTSLAPAGTAQSSGQVARRGDAVLVTTRDERGTWLSVQRKGKGPIAVNTTPLDSWGQSAISDDGSTVAYTVGLALTVFHLGARRSAEEVTLDRRVKGLVFTRGSQQVTLLQAGRVGRVADRTIQPLFEFAETPYQEPRRLGVGPLVVGLVAPEQIELRAEALLASPVSKQPKVEGWMSPDGVLVAHAHADGVLVGRTHAAAEAPRLFRTEVSKDELSTHGWPTVDDVRWSPDGKRLLVVTRFPEAGRVSVGRLDEFDVASGQSTWTSRQAPLDVIGTRNGWVLIDRHVERIEHGRSVYAAEGTAAVAADVDLLVSLQQVTVSFVGAQGLEHQVELEKRHQGAVLQTEVDRQGRWLAMAFAAGVAVIDLEDGRELRWSPAVLRGEQAGSVLLGWQGALLFVRRERDYLLFDARSRTELTLGLAKLSDAPPQFYAISPNGLVEASPEFLRHLSSEGQPLPAACHRPGLLREWLADVAGPEGSR